MYYYTTSTLDINPETQVIPLVLYTTTSSSGSMPSTSTPQPSISGSIMPSEPTSTPKQSTAARIAALEQLIRENNDNSHLRRVDMARILGVGLSRIKDDLRLLAAQGKVVFVGAGSHSGHWHLVGNPETEVEVEQWLSTPGYSLLHGSRGRHTSTSTPTYPILCTKNATSTPKCTMSPESKALAVAHTTLNCVWAVVQTPYVNRRDIACAPESWHTPFYFTRRLWRDTFAPLQPLLSRG